MIANPIGGFSAKTALRQSANPLKHLSDLIFRVIATLGLKRRNKVSKLCGK